jgi:ADP-dependent NAD(P)H-hydrate dehydratase / NAD(P)H-hydrate epimerase
MIPAPPILSCDEARALEGRLFAGDEAKEWAAMQRAGCALAAAVLRDVAEVGGFPGTARLLVLVGKGHNGGDALIAARAILERHPAARAEVLFVFGDRSLRPLAARAWRRLADFAASRVEVRTARTPWLEAGAACRYDLCLDGVFGFQFRPPATEAVGRLLEQINALPIRFRAAVDLPSAGLFRADFTYATGSVKAPVVDSAAAGRVRYLDLGFFEENAAHGDAADRVLTAEVLSPLAALRPPGSDKRTYGHLFVLGGSCFYPGAVLMAVLGALRSGAGLVTAFVPETLLPAFAARAPEAMWVGCPETPTGALALEGEHLLRERMERATALVLGPGMGRDPETLALAQSVVRHSPVPLVIDADAQRPEIVRAGAAPRIVTPHAGEFARISGGGDVRAFVADSGATVVLKGPVTRVCGREAAGSAPVVYHSFFGGPVLARGGSGDVLAGMIGGLLAQAPGEPLLSAARGVVWHGLAADLLARERGQLAVTTTQLLDFLPAALRETQGVRADTVEHRE